MVFYLLLPASLLLPPPVFRSSSLVPVPCILRGRGEGGEGHSIGTYSVGWSVSLRVRDLPAPTPLALWHWADSLRALRGGLGEWRLRGVEWEILCTFWFCAGDKCPIHPTPPPLITVLRMGWRNVGQSLFYFPLIVTPPFFTSLRHVLFLCYTFLARMGEMCCYLYCICL